MLLRTIYRPSPKPGSSCSGATPLLREQGMDALAEMRRCHERQAELFAQLCADFPLGEAELAAFLEGLAQQLLTIRATEAEALAQLEDALA